MRYRLAHYRECRAHREWNTTCPSCGRRGKFVPYIDTVTMRPVDDRQCGRCNRESNCGYHLPPRQLPRTGDFVSHRSHESHENRHHTDYFVSRESRESREERLLRSRLSALPSVGAVQFASVTMRTSRDSRENKPFARNNFREICEICVSQKNLREQEAGHYEKMRRACNESQPWGSHLRTWLLTQFPREAVDAALKRYRVGGTPDGATLWWQIDGQGRVRTGKAMQYNPLTGHRVKTPTAMPESPLLGRGRGEASGRGGGSINWAHRMRLYGEPTELVVPQCLFGEHLVASPLQKLAPQDSFGEINLPSLQPTLIHVGPRRGDSDAAKQDSPPWEGLGEAALVESEKTALILSILKPDTVWLATGGKQNLKAAMLTPLIGLDVALYPDADALHQWYTRAVELNRTLGTRLHIPTWYYNLMDHDEARAQGLDLADVVLPP